MINTALSSRCCGPNSRFLCRSTVEHVHGILLEHVYGILLDEKFLFRSVHAAFVNTKWYEAWLERTLLLDPIIFDMWILGVLSWAPGQPHDSHHARHKTHRHLLFRVCVVVLSSVTSRSVAAAAARSLMRFSPSCRGESLVGVRVHHSFWLCLTPSLCVFPAVYRHCLCFFLVSAESRHCLCFPQRNPRVSSGRSGPQQRHGHSENCAYRRSSGH